METLIFIVLGAVLAVAWRWRQWRAYYRAMDALDPETKHRLAWYEHCKAAPKTGAVTVGPGMRKIP